MEINIEVIKAYCTKSACYNLVIDNESKQIKDFSWMIRNAQDVDAMVEWIMLNSFTIERISNPDLLGFLAKSDIYKPKMSQEELLLLAALELQLDHEIMDFITNATSKEKKFVVEKINEAKIQNSTKFCILKLASVGSAKLGIVKCVKDLTGLGLKEAKDLVDSVCTGTPKILLTSPISYEDAFKIRKDFENNGARCLLEEYKEF